MIKTKQRKAGMDQETLWGPSRPDIVSQHFQDVIGLQRAL